MLNIYDLHKKNQNEPLNDLYYAKQGGTLFIADFEKITIWIVDQDELIFLDDYLHYEWLGMFKMEYGEAMKFETVSSEVKEIPHAVHNYHMIDYLKNRCVDLVDEYMRAVYKPKGMKGSDEDLQKFAYGIFNSYQKGDLIQTQPNH